MSTHPEVADFAKLLRQFRLEACLTQEALADQSGLGVRTIQDLERGVHQPQDQTLRQLSRALRLTGERRSHFETVARVAPRQRPVVTLPRGLHAMPPVVADPPTPPNNLPSLLSSFIGRDREIARIREFIARSRLVTLTGPGGVGKTRLALRVVADLVDDFPDGIFLVSLAPVGDPSLVASTIAWVLDVAESADRPLIEKLKEALRNRRMLLVLDNFEHLEAAAELVAELLVACPRLKALATSRAPLRLGGEYEFSVHPLVLPDRNYLSSFEELQRNDAIRLFVERSRAVRADFALTSQNAAAIAEICRRLDGLPLAIELAAVRAKLLSPVEILERLENRFGLLTGGPRDVPARQQTLRNTIAWSDDLLEESERVLFRRLAIFAGGCTLEAAAAVCAGGSGDVLDGLTALVDRSLLRREDVEGEARFTMLETIREYGLAVLADRGEEVSMSWRHAAYFLTLVNDRVRKQTTEGLGASSWDAGLKIEQPNLRTALIWYRDHDPAAGLRLAAGLGWFWVRQRDLSEGERWLATFLARAPEDPGVRARALLGLATLKRDRGDLAEAQRLFEESLVLCRQMNDRWGIGRSLIMLAYQARSAGDYEQATVLAEESLAIARELRLQDSMLWALTCLGQVQRLRRNFARVHVLLEEALQLSPGDLGVLYRLGLTAEDEGDYDRAEALYQQGLARVQPPASWDLVMHVHLARLTRKRGDRIRARRLLEEGLALARQNGMDFSIGWVLRDLAELDWLDNDPMTAHSRLVESLGLAQRSGNRQLIALGLLAAAKRSFENDEVLRAIRLFGAADLALPDYRSEWDGYHLEDYQRSFKEVRSTPTPDAFAAAWAEGQAMTLDQAVAYALDEDQRP